MRECCLHGSTSVSKVWSTCDCWRPIRECGGSANTIRIVLDSIAYRRCSVLCCWPHGFVCCHACRNFGWGGLVWLLGVFRSLFVWSQQSTARLFHALGCDPAVYGYSAPRRHHEEHDWQSPLCPRHLVASQLQCPLFMVCYLSISPKISRWRGSRNDVAGLPAEAPRAGQDTIRTGLP
jgi:hypothetical protein